MKTFVRMLPRAFAVLLAATVVLGVAYPLVILGVGQAFFPYQANGSVIEVDGKAVGSELLAQWFSDDGHMGEAKGKMRALYVEERRAEILRVIEEKKNISVKQICETFGVSAVTARGDLEKLENLGKLQRVHGGLFVLFALNNVPLFLVALLAGGLVSAACLLALKKNVTDEEEAEAEESIEA